MHLVDRQEIEVLYSTTGPNPPSSLRDASGPWKHNPTRIQTPSNPRQRFINNPYNGRTTDTLSKTMIGGNRTARQTLIPNGRQPKRQKIYNDGESSSGKAGVYRNAKQSANASHKVLIPREEVTAREDVIDVDDEEDTGKLFPAATSSPDPMLLSTAQKLQPHPFDETEDTNTLEDGFHTRELKRRRQGDSDDISEFGDSPLTMPLPGNVKRKATHYDNVVSNIPNVDLRKVERMKPNFKNLNIFRMKATPLQIVNHMAKDAQSGRSLRVGSWYLGRIQYSEDDSYFLVWESKSTALEIKCGSPTRPSTPTLCFHLDRDVTSFTCSDPASSKGHSAIIQFEPTRVQRLSGKPLPTGFTLGGPNGEGTITMQISNAQAQGNASSYQQFVTWVKSAVKDLSITRSPGALWETAERQEPDTRLKVLAPPSSSVSSLALIQGKRLSRDEETSNDGVPIEISPSVFKNRQERSCPKPISKDANVIHVPESIRHSARQPRPSNTRPPSVDSDELILVYPPAVTGAVNITNADINRLQPGEFLNDTLIEFGLKLWLKELEESDPELAKEVHVFSSFFYKKLNKRNLQEGYESVRKWTSKFDLFDKKYIIVPINEHLHWYLAIIYQPQHVLVPPPFQNKPIPISTRRRTRQSLPEGATIKPSESSPLVVEDNHSRHVSPSETVAESEVVAALLGSCTITTEGNIRSNAKSNALQALRAQLLDTDTNNNMIVDMDTPSSPSMYVSSTDDIMITDDSYVQPPRALSPTVSDYNPRISRSASSPETIASDDDTPSRAINDGDGAKAAASLFDDDIEDVVSASTMSAIKPQNFYGKSSNKGKERASVQIDPPPETEAEAEGAADEIDEPQSDDNKTTFIFTLDSLGSKHPQAIKILSEYLRMEAKDKKGMENTSKPIGKRASVPVQPNSCDCGIYLLHLTKTFMKNPVYFCHTICTKTNPTFLDRKVDWDDEATAGFRTHLTTRIMELSGKWKKERAAREELKKKETESEDSDSEIEVVGSVKAQPSPSKGKGRGKGKPTVSKAKRIR